MSERTSRFGGLDSFVINLLVINFFMSASGPVDGPMKPESDGVHWNEVFNYFVFAFTFHRNSRHLPQQLSSNTSSKIRPVT